MQSKLQAEAEGHSKRLGDRAKFLGDMAERHPEIGPVPPVGPPTCCSPRHPTP
jgi:hypothetical protein